ncbi:MAG: LytTR family DNA-binding domain-containing protein [Bacteroidales bacterium]|nr:LytTR family DNA-binding domain-containing protein [Bacteroidales bacterium]
MKCIVIDNDAKALDQICAYIEQDANLQLLKKFESSQEAQSYLQNEKNDVDLVFVEVDMPGLSGIDLVKSLIRKPTMVFMSANQSMAYDALKLGAADYLLKPFSYEDFKAAADKAARLSVCSDSSLIAPQTRSSKFVNNNRYIFIKSEYKVMRINLDQIKYVESMREYVRFHIEDSRPIMSLLTIKAVENYLPKSMFMRVHRSYIVNLDKINIIERARIVFDGDTFIPISEQYKEKFLAYLDRNFAQ